MHTLYPFRRGRGAVPGRTQAAFSPCSHLSPPILTSSPSSRPSWPAGRRTASSSAPSSSARAPRSGSSTRARPRPTACPASTTSGPASTRTSSAASTPCGGSYVARRGGWDTHGLPVEVEVEKKLGITGKRADRGPGRHRRVRPALPRVGLLLRRRVHPPDHAHRLLARHGCGLLDAEPVLHRVGVVAPAAALRPGAALRGPQGRPRTARAAARRSRATSWASPASTRTRRTSRPTCGSRSSTPTRPSSATPSALAVWTTTPWTLLSNTGVAVNPDLTYAVVDGLIMADELVDDVLGEGASARDHPRRRRAGAGRAALPSAPSTTSTRRHGADGWRVVPADYVTTEEGTGLVHLAPAFGEIDRQIGRENGLPSLNPVGPDGRFTDEIGWLAGQEVRASNTSSTTASRRPACWCAASPTCTRTRTAGAAAPRSSTGASRAGTSPPRPARTTCWPQNATIDWHPAHIRDGRFGEWLSNNVDWALSRDRYWGTPLPIWRCGRGHLHCIGSLAELSELCGRDVTGIDPHRPVIDEVVFACPTCAEAGRSTRRRAVGLPPGGAGHRRLVRLRARCRPPRSATPTSPGSAEAFTFPADFISEAIDQTRGWFYSLLAINTLVFGETPYKHVVCLGHIVDADGRKMSKSLGNIIDPWTILDTRGADALRWWMFSQGSPWTPTRRQPGGHRHRDARHVAEAVEHVQLLHHLRLAERVRPGRPRRPGAVRPRGRSTAGSSRGWPAPRLTVTDGAGRPTSRSMPRPPSPPWSTTSPTGTCAAAGAASGAPIPTRRPGTRWPRRPRCTRS